MIGVVAEPSEQELVREFFELFKTPWEFYRSEREYEVLLCAENEVPRNRAALVLVYGSRQNAFDRAQGIQVHPQESSPLLAGREWQLPIYGKWAAINAAGQQVLVDPDTRTTVAIMLDSGGQTFVRLGYDLFQEVRHLLVQGQPAKHARIPALEAHIGLLRGLILERGVPVVEIPPTPVGYSFVACLTHDVDHYGIRNHRCDHTMFGFLYRALVDSVSRWCRGEISLGQLGVNWSAACRLPLVHLGLAKDFWCQLGRYLEIENGAGSTFFVIPHRNQPGQGCNGRKATRRGASYELAQLGDDLLRLDAAGCEIGLHGIDAWCDAASGRTERARVVETSGTETKGVRMHWLFFSEQSPAVLEATGFSYDSTFGYNECVGLRAGTLQAFKPPGVTRLLELPLHIMDTAMFYPVYMNLSPLAAETVVAEMVETASKYGGALTINWHDRSIAPERLWDGFYAKLLSKLRCAGAWLTTAANGVAWFRKRRSAVIEQVIWNDRCVRIKASMDAHEDSLPGLRIRIHKPSAQSGGSGARFVDVAFEESMEKDFVLEPSGQVGAK